FLPYDTTHRRTDVLGLSKRTNQIAVRPPDRRGTIHDRALAAPEQISSVVDARDRKDAIHSDARRRLHEPATDRIGTAPQLSREIAANRHDAARVGWRTIVPAHERRVEH